MKIKLHKISIRDLVDGYVDNQEDGVVGYNGRLNIRPPFQREFVYKDKQRDEVVRSVLKNFPLNVMYWLKCEDEHFELLDGQQRTVSICRYVNCDFSVDYKFFHNLTQTEKQQILDYPLMIYICEGTDKEKQDWFEIINIAGEKLTSQELRNAIYTGEWLTDAKKHFSRTGCPAHSIAGKYLNGSSIRQDFLETAISWISDGKIEDYMAKNQHAQNANELWLYFQSVIQWVQAVFTTYRKEMKGIAWGGLYNRFKDKQFDTAKLETEIARLMMDDDVTKKSGIYEYVLAQDEKCLSIRAFTPSMKRSAYERQGGVCPKCKKHFEIDAMQADHIMPWAKGGPTTAENCQMLCARCNRHKSDA